MSIESKVSFPMVTNPLYETAAVYEEIPALTGVKAFTTLISPKLEDDYVTIAPSKSNYVRTIENKSGSVSIYSYPYILRII